MYFSEINHKYFRKNIDEVNNFISSTKIVEMYTNDFDEEYWSMYKAYEFLIYKTLVDSEFNIDFFLENKPPESKKYFTQMQRQYNIKKDILFEWLKMFVIENEVLQIQNYIKKFWKKTNKDSTIKGSNFHFDREIESLSKDFVINPFTGNKLKVIEPHKWISKDVKQRTVDLSKLEEGYYPEIIVDDGGIIIGQIDKLYVEKDGFYIDDYKTNKEIKTENPFQKMKGIAENLDDCNYNHYRIQIGIYSYILESYGYACLGNAITHCIYNEDSKEYLLNRYTFGYMKSLINKIVKEVYSKPLINK